MKKYFPLFLLMVVGVALRVYHNVDISLWHDEAFSALLIKYPWHEMMYRIGLDVHPPMYYIFLRFWHYGFGDSIWSLRGFSIVFGAAMIPLAYVFVRSAFKNERAALWAAALIALNPFQIQFVTEARMYTMGAFFALLAAYFLVKAWHIENNYYTGEKAALRMPQDQNSQRDSNLQQNKQSRRSLLFNYLGFALCVSIIMYTHYYLLFTTAALGAYALMHHFRHYGRQWKNYGYLLGSFILVGLLYLPWVKTFLFQFSQVSGAYWIPHMDRWSIPTTVYQMLLGLGIDITHRTQQILVSFVTIFSIYFLYRFVRKSNEHAWLVVFNVVAPFAGALAFAMLAAVRGENTSVFLVRYFLFASTFYTIALAVWLESIHPKWWARTLLIIYCMLNLAAFFHYWKGLDVKNKPGMAGAAKFLVANVEPQHKLYVGSSFEFFNLKYYLSQLIEQKDQKVTAEYISRARPLLYSGGATSITALPHFAGTAILTDVDLLPDFATATVPDDTVWLLWTNGFGGSKPSVPKNWTQIDEQGFAEVRPYVGTWVVVTEYKVN